MAFRLRISGARACFARPEFRVDRISYDVLTPLAARAILDAIYWRPQMRWRIDAIHVLSPIVIAEEEQASTDHPTSRRKTIALVDIDYLIDVHFELIEPETPDGNAATHTKMFLKRARARRYFRQPFLGLPEYPAAIELIENGDEAPQPCPAHRGSRDIGWITHDIDNNAPQGMRFFRATMEDGTILVPPAGSPLLAV